MEMDVRVYYEDTDTGGVVYYANYLKYFERGRTELLRDEGVSLTGLQERGFIFVVTRAEADYHGPARYGDLLKVTTELTAATGATITFTHSVKRDGEDKALVTGTVTLACVGADGKPTRLPEEVKAVLP